MLLVPIGLAVALLPDSLPLQRIQFWSHNAQAVFCSLPHSRAVRQCWAGMSKEKERDGAFPVQDGAFPVRTVRFPSKMVRFPSGRCVSRPDGAFPVRAVRFPSGRVRFPSGSRFDFVVSL